MSTCSGASSSPSAATAAGGTLLMQPGHPTSISRRDRRAGHSITIFIHGESQSNHNHQHDIVDLSGDEEEEGKNRNRPQVQKHHQLQTPVPDLTADEDEDVRDKGDDNDMPNDTPDQDVDEGMRHPPGDDSVGDDGPSLMMGADSHPDWEPIPAIPPPVLYQPLPSASSSSASNTTTTTAHLPASTRRRPRKRVREVGVPAEPGNHQNEEVLSESRTESSIRMNLRKGMKAVDYRIRNLFRPLRRVPVSSMRTRQSLRPSGHRRQQRQSAKQEKVDSQESDDSQDKDWQCPVCRTSRVGPIVIFCDSCHNWFHYSCVGIKRNPATSFWYCPPCSRTPLTTRPGAATTTSPSAK